MDVTTSLQMFALLILMPVAAGMITYQIILSNAKADKRKTYEQVKRELEMQAAVREENKPWWAAR